MTDWMTAAGLEDDERELVNRAREAIPDHRAVYQCLIAKMAAQLDKMQKTLDDWERRLSGIRQQIDQQTQAREQEQIRMFYQNMLENQYKWPIHVDFERYTPYQPVPLSPKNAGKEADKPQLPRPPAPEMTTEEAEDFFQRLFEPMPADWKTKFKVGDKVRMAREGWFHKVPLGTVGVVVDDPENVMAMKGQK